jgi:hypothetical protein
MKSTSTLIILLLLSACSSAPHKKAQKDFFSNLSTLCGQVFSGYSTFPEDPGHDFAGQLLVADFSSCEKKQIRIRFAVGHDQSRTWIITRSRQGLLLKHDHRHADGSPDEITNYGGWATAEGSAWQQHFAADEATAALIPAAATNVWMLRYDPASQVLTYDLQRHGQPRYQAQLRPQDGF